jgi:hypothetical protein
MNEHLFIIFHLKTKVFPLSMDALVKKSLVNYDIKPLKN